MKTIVLTGGGTAGHIMPHIAIKDSLKKHFDKIYYIGSTGGMETNIVGSLPDITFYSIDCCKLNRKNIFKNITLPVKFLKSVHQAKKILNEIKPNIVFSKGGYVALPVVFAAKELKIPVIAHESDLSLGLSNKLSKLCTQKICTTFEQTAKAVGKKGEYTGSPIRIKTSSTFTSNSQKPILLITGGSQGSKAINEAVWQIADELTKTFCVYHQVGKGNYNNSISIDGYNQFEFSDSLQEIMKASSMVISRAGSNTIFEIAYNKKPMLLIPLPKGTSRGDQVENAKYFNKKGYAKVLFQDDLTPETLLNCIKSLYNEQNEYINRLKNAKIPNGNDKIVDIILKFAK